MGFFFCPRIRRYRNASDSSDLVATYQLAPTQSSPTHEPTEGVSWSTNEHAGSERLSSSSGGLSARVRRRFSRDARDLYRQPKRLDRGPKIPFLRFPSKHPTVHATQVSSYDIGSSLMSERGYDSDAQHIATPRHPIYTTEHPSSRTRNGMAMSPRRPPLPLREPDLQSSRDQTVGLTMDNRGIAYEQPSYSGEGGELQPSWRWRDHEQRLPQVAQESPSSFHNVDLGSPRGRPSSPSPSMNKAWTQERPTPVHMRSQEMHCPLTPPAPMRAPIPRGGSSEDSIGRRSGHSNDAGVIVYPSHHVLKQQGHTTSVDSLAGCPPRLSVRKRHQRRRRDMIKDELPIHLGEMNIHKMLASSGSSSHLQYQKHPFDENHSSSNTGTWNADRYHTLNSPTPMPPNWDASKVKSPSMQPSNVHDPRSPYSPKTSVSSTGHEYDEQNFLNFVQDSSGNIPSRSPYFSSENASASAAAEEANGLKSKFTERLGSDRSVSPAGFEPHKGYNEVPPRTVSIGWMSEGRRIGYGYTLVPAEDSNEGHEQIHCGTLSPGVWASNKGSPKGSLAGSEKGRPDRQKPHPGGKDKQRASKTGETSFYASTILQRLNIPSWNGTNFALKTSNNSDAGSCDSGGSSLFGILTNKKKTPGGTEPNFNTDNPWEFCSWVRPAQSSGGQQAPQQDVVGFRKHAEAQLIKKLATLRQGGSAWATKRKASKIAHNLEKRAVAKFAASAFRHPVVQRTATRVLGLRAPETEERPHVMHVRDSTFSETQFDGFHGVQNSQHRPSERTSSGSSGDWDSLYEECLEEHSILE